MAQKAIDTPRRGVQALVCDDRDAVRGILDFDPFGGGAATSRKRYSTRVGNPTKDLNKKAAVRGLTPEPPTNLG